MKKLSAAKIGVIAAEMLSTENSGNVIGVTSKGVFLRAGDSIAFITDAEYRSPFNLTLDYLDHSMDILQPGSKVILRPDELYFPEEHLTISTNEAEVWIPSSPVKIKESNLTQSALVEECARSLLHKDPQKGFLFLVHPPSENEGKTVIQKTRNSVEKLISSFKKQDSETFKNAAKELLGSGGGLTPSGDDLLTGFFLYHTRYDRASNKERKYIREWHAEILREAYTQTTTISANRLAAAGRGWSEELFLHVIDAIFDSSIRLNGRDLETLANFGHSSGVDTFTGIYFAVKSML